MVSSIVFALCFVFRAFSTSAGRVSNPMIMFKNFIHANIAPSNINAGTHQLIGFIGITSDNDHFKTIPPASVLHFPTRGRSS